MAPRTEDRLRFALRLLASVFLLSSPCAGCESPGIAAHVTTVTEPDAIPRTFAAAYQSVR